ncbi:MAG: PAS domain S-box protein [Ignavibacteria bacterium]|jgi:PAS domain S-box-containing protein|nr:PAS domain S-box protein [Ignavibacteria bacterium]MCU7517003.1 PAS domain S-box protein [Ignavibacteria bacterium]
MNKTKAALSQELAALKQDYANLKEMYEKEIHDRKHIGGVASDNGGNIRTEFAPENGELRMPDGQSVRQLFKDYIKMYASRDDSLTNHFSENFSGFTGGGDFLVRDKEEWIVITRQDFAQVKETIHIEIKDLAVQSLSDTVAVTTGFFTIHLPIKDHILSRETARLVLIFCKEESGWKISHSSISIPYYLVREGEVYPLKELTERNEALEETVAARTLQLSEANEKLQNANEELAREFTAHRQTVDELRKSEHKYRLLIESANEAIVVIQDGIPRLTNAMASNMSGYSKEELEKTQFTSFIHPEERIQLAENHQKRMRGEAVPNYYVFRLLTKDGSTRWIYMNAVLIDWEGSPATLNFLTDITESKLAEEALEQSNRKWEAVIAASPDGIGMLSLDGKIQLISEKLVKMHGYPVEEMEKFLGTSVIEHIHPSNHQLLIDNTHKLLSGKKVDQITEYLALRKDKSCFNIDINTRVLYDSAGKPQSILYVERDITKRKLDEAALQHSRQKLEAIISASPDGIGIISLDGKMQFMSDKLIQMYGYSIEEKDELTGRSAFDFIDPSDYNRLTEYMHKLITGQSDHKIREYLAIKKDNSRFYVELNYTVLPDTEGNPASILFVERDSTERKLIEEETAKINLELAELNATKDKFFSIIAHDLKSPFQGLIGCSQILSSEYSTLSEEEKMSFIGSIEEISRNSYKLLENLLDWSRMQTGQMIVNMEDFNLLVELYPTISLIKQTAINKKIEFNYIIDNSIFVRADKNMLSTVVRNLAANSIKFTNPGGRIILAARKLDNLIEVSVTDSGIGIEKDIIDNLFKIDKSISKKGTANEQGTGLGLLLCKEMIEKHGGKIRVESKVGQGSTFSFTIASA